MSGWNPFGKKHDYKDPANVKSLQWTEIIRLNPEKVDKNIVGRPGFYTLNDNQQRALIDLVRIKDADKRNKSLPTEARQRELDSLVAESERRIHRLIGEDKETDRKADAMVSRFMDEAQMEEAKKIEKRLPPVPSGPITTTKSMHPRLGGKRRSTYKSKRKGKNHKTKSKNKRRRTLRSKKINSGIKYIKL